MEMKIAAKELNNNVQFHELKRIANYIIKLFSNKLILE